jgi:large subunit ribosomal protein L23
MSPVAKKEAAPKAAKAKAPKTPKAKKETGKGGAIHPRHYDVLVRPLITEKSTKLSELNKVVFKISPDATKRDVKQAVEALFNVTVRKVNTMNVEGKVKRFKGRPGQRSDLRKAIVTLAEGQSIDFAGTR